MAWLNVSQNSVRLWKVDPLRPDGKVIQKAASILRSGGLVAFPTETVYGLGANAFDREALAGIFRVKGRPQDNPLIVHVADRKTVFQLAAETPQRAIILMDTFWPGPLTIILPKNSLIPDEVSAGLNSVALRMPAHPVALELIREAGIPVAAPSANLSGRPSPTTAGHVLKDLGNLIDAVLDGGPADLGLESTVLDLTLDVPAILRPGGVTPEEISRVIGGLQIYSSSAEENLNKAPVRSPGMKYKHYAPEAPVFIIEGEPLKVARRLGELLRQYQAEGKKVGVLAYEENAQFYSCGELIVAGRRQEPAGVAARLYSALRHFDELGVDVILAEGMEPKGLGLAIMNRLYRAAGGRVIRV
jgi:L-threonylcarbamoyladenylate synthase